jgi:hypothetical protein
MSYTHPLFYELHLPVLYSSPKLDKDTSKKEKHRPHSITNIDIKILNKIMAN